MYNYVFPIENTFVSVQLHFSYEKSFVNVQLRFFYEKYFCKYQLHLDHKCNCALYFYICYLDFLTSFNAYYNS
jgi:hypothetical protein